MDLPSWCLATTPLTPDEYRTFDEMPDGAHSVEADAVCWLQEGHGGEHATLGQTCGEEHFEWWFFWCDVARRMERVEMCPEVDSVSTHVCLLPIGHWGRHGYGLD